jgi:hypothetical protein
MKVSPNVFTRELSNRYGTPVSGSLMLRMAVGGRIPASMNERGTRWQLDLADLDAAAEALGLTKIPTAA